MRMGVERWKEVQEGRKGKAEDRGCPGGVECSIFLHPKQDTGFPAYPLPTPSNFSNLNFFGNADFGYLGPWFECLYMEVSCNLTPFNSQMR